MEWSTPKNVNQQEMEIGHPKKNLPKDDTECINSSGLISSNDYFYLL